MTTDISKVSNLDTAKPVGLNLSASYWSPSNVGETKRLYFIEIKTIMHVNDDTGEAKDLPTAVFVDPSTKEVIHQGSARLVAIFQRENVPPLTAFQITYKGKVKNSTNQFSSDAWEVYYLQDGQKV
jgi:hypothetical protein